MHKNEIETRRGLRVVFRRPFAAIESSDHFNLKKLFKKVAAVATGGLSEVAQNKKVQEVVKKAANPLTSLQAPKAVAQMVKKPVVTPMVPQTMHPSNMTNSIKVMNPQPATFYHR